MFSTPEAQQFLGAVIYGSLMLLPLPAMAYWGWRYGASAKTTLAGFAFRLATVGLIGAWSWGIFVGHGASLAPLPAALCGYFDYRYSYASCFPQAWVTPTVTVVAFFVFAYAGERRRIGLKAEQAQP